MAGSADMGTRADFYINRGTEAQWLGSVAMDGYPEGMPADLLASSSREAFAAVVAEMISSRDDATPPEAGWPWPWTNSHTTDFAYMFEDGSVWVSCFGREWCRWAEYQEIIAGEEACEEWDGDGPEPVRPRQLREKAAEVPDMSDLQRVTFGRRSGVIILR